MTQALATFGVLGRLPDDVFAVLELANEYREKLCALYQERHERTINLRNDRFPALFAALMEWESAKAQVARLDGEIKAHHAKLRDRNAVQVRQRAELEAARKRTATAYELVKAGRAQWNATLAAWRKWFTAAADWKNVKSLAKRRTDYAAVRFPRTLFALSEALGIQSKVDVGLVSLAALEAYGRLDLECDLRERELSAEYQANGLSSGIRGEIDEASAPKLGKSGPGMRYVYGRPPDVSPWKKLTNQFAGGLSVDSATEGTGQFRLQPETGYRVWRVWQQIGTAAHPRLISYPIRLHRPFPTGTRLQRWSLSVEAETLVRQNKHGVVRETTWHRGTAVPIIAEPLAKPTGEGVLRCRLSWRRVPGGVQVAEFLGAHVCERFILPAWLVDARMDSKETLAGCDTEANEFLALLGERPLTGRRQGVVALRQYCFTHPDDAQARSLLESMVLEVFRARRTSRRAIRSIEKIYETAVSRVCRLHGELAYKKIDFVRRKRYDTRNLLAQDAPPEQVRELLHAVAPGKLQELLISYGLPASGDVADDSAWTARGEISTDIFTSYVASIGRRGAGVPAETGGARKAASGALARKELE